MEANHNFIIECPMVPNFVHVEVFGEKKQASIKLIPEEQLRALGAEWTEKLVAKSKEKTPRTP